MSKHDERVYLLHILDHAKKAVDIAKNQSREDIDKDEKLRLALTHLMTLVGESATRISKETQNQHSDIPWQKMIGIRNRLIHGYDFVDYDILWITITKNLPILIEKIEEILK